MGTVWFKWSGRYGHICSLGVWMSTQVRVNEDEVDAGFQVPFAESFHDESVPSLPNSAYQTP